jgi:hypothetical protein
MIKSAKKNYCGFSLIEILIVASVFVILLFGIYSLVILSLKVSQDNKYYSEATSLANKKMEELHNLTYGKVGTINGSPSGVIPEKESVKISIEFLVTTTIVYYDDPYDGTLISGNDSVFTDYKIASINISWQGRNGEKNLTFFTKIIPQTEESPTGFGLLKISVVDANGLPVASAKVSVVNKNILPIIDANYTTNIDGLLVLPLPPAIDGYEVSVSKNGYNSEKTYARNSANPNPTKPNYSIFSGEKTEDSFSIDLLAEVEIKTLAPAIEKNIKISESSIGASNDFPKAISDSEKNLYYIWQRQIDSNNPNIYWQKFSDSGNKLWPNDKLIAPGSNPDMNIFGNDILAAVWQSDYSGENDVYFQFFNKQGDGLFLPKSAARNSFGEQINPRLAIDKTGSRSTTTVIWQDNRNGNWDIFSQAYNTKGEALWDEDLQLSNGTQINSAPQIISLENGDYLVAWVSNNESDSGVNQLLIQRFNEQGELFWSEAKTINNLSTMKSNLGLAYGGQENFYIAYVEKDTVSNAVLEKISLAGEVLWRKKINQNRSDNSVLSSSVVYSENGVIAVWAEKNPSNSDVYAQKYDEIGNRLWEDDLRLNLTVNSSNQDQPFVASLSSGNFLSVWRDDREGTPIIYSLMFSGDYNNSARGGVPFIITGTKKIGENPVIYKVNSEYRTDSNGHLQIPMEWDGTGYTIKLSSGYSGIIESSEPEMPIAVRAGKNITVKLIIK